MKKQLTQYFFIIVSITTLLTLSYIPMMTTIKYSFYDVSMLGLGEKSNGLANYRLLLNNNPFLKSLANTFILTFMGLLPVPLGFTLASLINDIGEDIWQGFFRVGYCSPNIITGVSVTLIFRVVLRTSRSMLNSLLSFLAGHEVAIGWLSDFKHAQFGATTLYVWQNLGYFMLTNLASSQSVPQGIYETMEVDGTSGLQRWFYITIPQIRTRFALLFITGMINGLARLTDLFIIGGNSPSGRPGRISQTILMSIYQLSFENPQYGITSAGAVILFSTTFIMTTMNLLTTRLFKRKQG